MNPYAYVGGNPETKNDPTGHWGWTAAGFVWGVIVPIAVVTLAASVVVACAAACAALTAVVDPFLLIGAFQMIGGAYQGWRQYNLDHKGGPSTEAEWDQMGRMQVIDELSAAWASPWVILDPITGILTTNGVSNYAAAHTSAQEWLNANLEQAPTDPVVKLNKTRGSQTETPAKKISWVTQITQRQNFAQQAIRSFGGWNNFAAQSYYNFNVFKMTVAAEGNTGAPILCGRMRLS